MIDIGSARLGMTVAEMFRRNRKITQHDEHQRQHERELHVVDRRLDRLRPVVQRRHVHRLGISLWMRASAAFTPLATLTVFVPGCRWTASTIARLAVDPARGLVVLHVVGDAADIAQVDRRAVAVRDDHVGERRRRCRAARVACTVSAVLRPPEHAGRDVHVLGGRPPYTTSSSVDASGRERLRVELDAHRVLLLCRRRAPARRRRPSTAAARSSSRRTRRASRAAPTAT